MRFPTSDEDTCHSADIIDLSILDNIKEILPPNHVNLIEPILDHLHAIHEDNPALFTTNTNNKEKPTPKLKELPSHLEYAFLDDNRELPVIISSLLSNQEKNYYWRYSEWCNENSHDKKPRPRDYTFKEWVKLKKGHLDISDLVRKDLFRSWVIDQFTEALDPDKNPLERCLDEYNWDEEKTELGNEDYDPPMVHTETFEVTKYKFNNGCSFICVSGENNETMSLGRKNGSRIRKMIMEEMEEVHGNDGEDSDDET
ncbi:hypothetical protein Tco_1554279 [Tanacetum coccineum]